MDNSSFPIIIKKSSHLVFLISRRRPSLILSLDTIEKTLYSSKWTGYDKLSKELEQIIYQEQLMERGAQIGLGLLNGIEYTEEMGQCYTKFKPACDPNTSPVMAKI